MCIPRCDWSKKSRLLNADILLAKFYLLPNVRYFPLLLIISHVFDKNWQKEKKHDLVIKKMWLKKKDRNKGKWSKKGLKGSGFDYNENND